LRLNALTVDRFRNLAGSRIQFRGPVTLFYGPNAQGKTNVLEAIYLLGTTRSFRENRLKYLVRDGEHAARVEGEVVTHGTDHTLTLELGSKGKQYKRDGSTVGLSQYLQTLPVVVLSVEDRGLVEGIPRYRRDFLDGTAVWRRPAYLETLMTFGRAREHRNAVLKAYTGRSDSELAAWTETFAKLGEEIREERRETTQRVNAVLEQLAGDLPVQERIRLVYEPSGGADLGRALKQARPEEIRRGSGLVGPQRDGVEILLDGRPLASYGSGGQVRTALWLLKLTRVHLLAERDAQPPLFLLDDVEAELDQKRIDQMMRLTENRAQVVMTATRPLDAHWGTITRFRVESGRIVGD